MIRGLCLLLLCQLAGEASVRLLALPVPGPALGFLLLFALLLVAGRLSWQRPRIAAAMDDVGGASDRLLAALGLLFVPAGAGIVQNIGVFLDDGLALAATLVLSLLVTLVVTVLVFLAVTRLVERGEAARVREDGE